MPTVVVVHPPGAGDELDRPRDDPLVRERSDGEGRFVADGGPFSRYERTLRRRDDGAVEERIAFRIAAPFWGLLFVPGYRRGLARPPRRAPWWAPPERLDPRATSVLGLLCSASIVVGYLGTLITQTLTYAGLEFGTTTGGQADVLSLVRFSVVLLVPLVGLADRFGRRRLIAVTAGVGCVVTATAAVAPNLLSYGISQTVARGFAGALLVLIGIVSAEEMPAGSRAYAFSLLSMTAALGAGICVWFLPLVDDSLRAWRLLYVFALALLPLVLVVAKRLPESRRFTAPHGEAHLAGHGRRFWLLATTGFLLALFATPSSQLGNEYLREVRGFSSGRIALFTIGTVTPAAIGVVVGGRLADVRGRRWVGAIGILGGTSLSIATYSTSGWVMWVVATGSSVLAGAVVPALGVYRPELFPTALRGRAGGAVDAFQLAGAVVGLQLIGRVVDAGHSFGTAFALAGIAPLVVIVLVLTVFPETAHRSLEDLNPEDRPP